ncbi:pilin [Pseudomonas coleopterorum]|nr:pilin [Pseudomonas coleopterorum]MDY1018579.1 pilin [Pseudomonas coleopterorum]
MKSSRAFTLIELMIVIAILGIISAIAIPLFLKYSARAKLTAGFSEMSMLKRDVQMALDQGVDVNSTADISAPSTTANCSSITATGFASSGLATITCTVANGPASINGKTMTWSRTNAGGWACTSSVSAIDSIVECPGV